jgi:hypothetical protein
MAVHLEHERYISEYRAPPIPEKMAIDSHYGVCFRACLSHIFDVLATRGYRDTLHVVVESGHKNAWDCHRIFEDTKARWRRRGANFMGDFTLKSKNECAPLMLSDYLAASYSIMRETAAERGMHPSELPETDPPVRGKAGLTFLELQPDALRHLKENFEADRQQQIAACRAARSARLSGPSSLLGSAS